MPNIFDQFDTPTPTIAPDAKNPFDAFDGNVFDQFDKPAPLKFANLPGDIKLNPLQRIQLQTRLQDPENPTGQDNTFLTALSEGGSPLAFAKNLATLPFALPMSAVSESIKPFAAPIMNALADVGEADTPIVQPKGEPSAADVVMYQLGLGKKRDNYQPDEFFQPGEPMLPKELFPYADETQRGILPAATRALLGMSTPENALLAGAAPLAPEAIGGGFFAGTVASIPDSLQRLATARNGEDFKDAATELGLNLGMAVLMAHGLIPKPGPVMTPEEAAANRSDVLASLPPGFEKSANSALPPLTTTDWAQGPAPDPNATNPLRYEQPGTPIQQNKDDLEAAVQNLQNILRGKLPLQEQPTVNNPSDQADQIIRNVFPAEEQAAATLHHGLLYDRDSTNPIDPEQRYLFQSPERDRFSPLPGQRTPEEPSFSERAERAEQVAQKLEPLKTGIGNGGQLHAFGVAADLWDRAVAVAQKLIRAGGTAGDAIEAAIRCIKENFTGDFDEGSARAALARSLVLRGNVRTESEQSAKVSTPGQARSATTGPPSEWGKYDLRKIPVGSDPIPVWRSFPKSETSVTPQELPKTSDSLRVWAKNQLARLPNTVRSPWGKEVVLHQTRDVASRANQYIAGRAGGGLSRDRAEMLPMIAHTVRNAMAYATTAPGGRAAYLYRYADGRVHVVLVDPRKGTVERQFVQMQYSRDPSRINDSDLRVLYRNGIEGTPWGILSSGKLSAGQIPSSLSATRTANKSALTNSITPKNEAADEQPKKTKILGGAYKDIVAGQGQRHHMPAVSVSTLSRDDGPALWMDAADHAKTASHGNNGSDGTAYRTQQAALIEQGRFDEALQMDIDDIRSKFGTKYDEGIRQMLDYYKTIPRWKLKLN